MKSPKYSRRSFFYLALSILSSPAFFAQEDDHEFASPNGWRWLSETGEDDASWRPAEGFLGHHFQPLKDRMIEPVDGDGGFDNVAPQLAVEEGPGGLEWDVSPTYRTLYKGGSEYPAGSGTRLQGNNWFMRMPYAINVSASNQWRLRYDANTFRVFNYYFTDASSQQHYLGSYGTNNNELVWNSSLGELKLYDIRGKIYTFSNSASYRLTKIQGRGTNQITITYGPSSITVLQKPNATAGSEVRRFVYTLTSNRIDKIDIEEKVGGIWRRYRKIDFTYHEDVTEGAVESTTGDLIGIEEFTRLSINCVDNPGPCDPGTTPGAWISRKWVFKYWTSVNYSEPGYRYQIRAVLGPQSVKEWEMNPVHAGLVIHTQSTTGTLLNYVDRLYSYDILKRLAQLTLKGDCGCGTDTGNYVYVWVLNGITPSNLNTWWRQVTITMPSANGSSRIIDYNKYGQRLNHIAQEVHNIPGSRRWIETWRHNTNGFLTDSYSPAACGPNSYNTSTHIVTPVEPANPGGQHFQFTSSVNHSLGTVKLRDPNNGNWNYQIKNTFSNYTNGDRRLLLRTSHKTYPLEATTDTGSSEITYAYTFHPSDPLAMKKRTTTLPVIPTNKNGSGYAVINMDFFESDGLHTWHRISQDHNGGTPEELIVNYIGYDSQRRLITKTIMDIKTNDSGMPVPPETDFQNTSLYALSLVTEYEYDYLGRLTKAKNPPFDAWTGSAVASCKQTQQWYYTKLYNGESVTVEYQHLDDSYFHYPLSLLVQDYDGHVITTASGVLSSAYRDTDLSNDIDTSQGNIEDAFKWGAQNRGSLVGRTDFTHEGSHVVKEEIWSEATNGNLPKYTTEYTFDSAGRMVIQKTHAPGQVDPSPTIVRWGYDVHNRIKSTKVGTVDGGGSDNMTLITELFYDGEESGSLIGDGNITRINKYTAHQGTPRTTDIVYDYRHRIKESNEPLDVKHTFSYTDQFDPQNTIPTNRTQPDVVSRYTAAGTVLLSKIAKYYDPLGRIHESKSSGIAAGAESGYANILYWYNGRGLVVKTRSNGKLCHKIQYDGAGRATNRAVSYETAETDYIDADDLENDTVIEETRYVYDKSGAIELVQHYRRKHEAQGTGSLITGIGGNGRASFIASWCDKIHRPTHSVNYGANAGNDMTLRPTGNPPFSSSGAELVARYGYYLEGDLYGNPQVTLTNETAEYVDTRGIITLVQNDDNGNVVKYIENFSDWTPGTDNDRTTQYTYDALGRLHKTIAKASTMDQVTENVYGVVRGFNNSQLSSNQLVYTIKHANPSSGQASSNPVDQESFGYSAQEEVVWKKDQAGTEHTFTYDGRGRVVNDQVSNVPIVLDRTISKISRSYDGLDRITSVKSHNDIGSTVNEVVYEYGKYNTVTAVKQEWNGAVNGGSKQVQFSYQLPTDGTAALRCTATTYPNGVVIVNEYEAGTDDCINRLTRKTKQGSQLYRDIRVGFGGLVERQYGATSALWTLIGENPENGDYYSGLDNFGRIDNIVVKKGSTQHNNYSYTYNYGSQVTFRDDAIGNIAGTYEFDELFAYDNLGRLTDLQRGQYGSGMMPLRLHECWTLDSTGNTTNYYSGTAAVCGTTFSATFNASNEFSYWSGGSTAFNNQGDITLKASKEFTYDAWNRLTLVTDSVLRINLSIFKYNGLNQVISRSGSPTQPAVNYYYNDNWQLLEETLLNGTTRNWYVWGDNHIDDLVVRGPGTEYYVLDAYNNVVTRLEYDGDVYKRYLYKGYMTPTQRSADWLTVEPIVEDLHLAAGRLYVSDCNIYHYRHRSYDPQVSFFVSPDPVYNPLVDFGSVRRFLDNDPTNLEDPMGLREGRGRGLWHTSEINKLLGTDGPGPGILPPTWNQAMQRLYKNLGIDVVDFNVRSGRREFLRSAHGASRYFGIDEIEERYNEHDLFNRGSLSVNIGTGLLYNPITGFTGEAPRIDLGLGSDSITATIANCMKMLYPSNIKCLEAVLVGFGSNHPDSPLLQRTIQNAKVIWKAMLKWGRALKFTMDNSTRNQTMFNWRDRSVQDFMSQFKVGSLKEVMPNSAKLMKLGEALKQGIIEGVNVRKLLTNAEYDKVLK